MIKKVFCFTAKSSKLHKIQSLFAIRILSVISRVFPTRGTGEGRVVRKNTPSRLPLPNFYPPPKINSPQ